MKQIFIIPLETEEKEDTYIRSCKLDRYDEDALVKSAHLYYAFPKFISPPEKNDCDAYLTAILMDAMSEQRKIIVRGSVSKLLLVNLMEFQGCWNKWLPETYRKVEIQVNEIRHGQKVNHDAICAFSGGVDSTFSVWRNYTNRNQIAAIHIKSCVFIHGFDIPLSYESTFSNAFETAKTTLKDINIELLPVKTNFREISNLNWEHNHLCALVSCLNNLKSLAGICLIGSSKPYDGMVIPWGSNPVSDPLLSSGDFMVKHDGATHSRIEKVNEIADWAMGCQNLRVCWEGPLKDRNCGRCEKCLRTKMDFLVTSNFIPKCFPDWNEKIDLKGIKSKHMGVSTAWKSILYYAEKKNYDKRFLLQIARCSKIHTPIKDKILPHGSRCRNLAIKLKRKLVAVFQ